MTTKISFSIAKRFSIPFALLFLSLSPVSSAQVTTATLSGTVKDETGAVMPRVAVTVRNVETGMTRTAETAAAGSYRVAGLGPGTYELAAELSGFKTEVRSGIKLAVGQEAVVDLTMQVGNVAEKVTVVGEAPLVDTTSSVLSGLVDDRKIRDLPLNARSFTQLAFLQPGVVEFKFERPSLITGRASKMNVGGMRPSSNNFLLDGTYINDATGRTPGSAAGVFLGIETVREFRVLTNAFSAEYGSAAGGVVNAVTKSGTNEFHGTTFWFHRNDNLDARNFFDPNEPPEFRRHQFGFAAGGPVQKDRTFFFGAAEWFREWLGVTRVARVPSLAARRGDLVPVAEPVRPYLEAMFPIPNGRDLGSGFAEYIFPQDQVLNESFFQLRLDHTFSDTDSVFGRYTFDDATGVRSAATPNPLAVTNELNRNQYLTLEYKRVLSSTLLNAARFAYNRTNLLGTNRFLQKLDPSVTFVPDHPLGTAILGGIGEWGQERRFPVRLLRNLFSYSDDVAYFQGRHSMKAGLLAQRFQDNNLNAFNPNGTFSFPSVLDFLQARPDRFETASAGSAFDRAWRQWLFGFYVQDDFRLKPNLTLNLGLRYEFVTTMQEALGRENNLRDVLRDADITVGDPMLRNPSLRNFAPRFGFAWDPYRNGKTSVRGGFGLYYDAYLSHYTFPAHILAPPFFQGGFLVPASPGFAFPRPLLPSSFPNPLQNIQIAYYNAQNPYSMQYHLNLQREIFPDLIFTIGYAGSRGVNLIRGGAVNIPIPQIVEGRKFFPAGATRRNPNWADIDLKRGDGNSWYNSLQLSALKRFSRGYQFQASYTFARTLDEGSGFLFNDTITGVSDPQDPDNRAAERGLAAFHVKHNLVFNYTFDVPVRQQQRGTTGKLLGGWQVNGITAIRSGMPFTPGVRADRARALLRRVGQTHPDLKPGRKTQEIVLGNSPVKKTGLFFDPRAFALQPAGFFGNAGRNILLGPDLVNFDFSLVKNTRVPPLGEGGNFQIRIEFFNIFNRTNFSPPDPFVFAGTRTTPDPTCPAEFECPLPTAGTITSTATSSRQIQFALKLLF